ncbi:hypothetical protein V6N13_026544 [Hibiscus sabdariffa]
MSYLRYISLLHMNHPYYHRAQNVIGKTRLGKKNVRAIEATPALKNSTTVNTKSREAPVAKSSDTNERLESEVGRTLEVCNLVGLEFNASKEVVCNRLKEIASENVDHL